ncbi:hypothetical protein WME99_21015 [Sorangium sp. So ce136]|uniref:hypothetical protein n=1 Tax=Sorangium sp. So ce136 TaxID=3133284 RepID=UPI003F030114
MRRSVLHPEPLGVLHEPVGPSLEEQIAAREALEAMTSLPDWQVEALLSVDVPESVSAYARRHRMNPHTALSRPRIARESLAVKLWRRT